MKYRLPNPTSFDSPQLIPVTDAWRALGLLRELAGQYGVDKNKVGLLEFSAGIHLATVASLWKPASADERPNFPGLMYGTTNLSVENIQWLEESLYFCQMPPAFLAHASDDAVCYIEESTLYAQKLFENHASVEMHLFPRGGHIFGLGRAEDGTNQWPGLFINLLKRLGEAKAN